MRAIDNVSASDVVRRLKRLGAIGVLTAADLPDLDTQRGRVLALMSDLRWHFADEIREVAGGSEGLRRLRELRDIPGLDIARRRIVKGRYWQYKLVHDQFYVRNTQSELPF